MKIGSVFPSKYVKASDLPDGQFVQVVIDRVEVENVAGNGQPEEDKAVIYFTGKQKGIVLNKTNSQIIADAYGDETDDWVGKKISLYSTTTLFQGKNVACIRVKVVKAAAAPRVAPPKPATPAPIPTEYQGEEPPGAPVLNDSEIPF